MLFCFGLFALLLYYTVVANAECSYTYRHSSQQPIEARSWEYQRQGFTRCQFLIQLVNKHQQLRLNFTRLTGFGLSANPSQHGSVEEEEGEGDGGWKVGGPKGSPGGHGGVGQGETPHRQGWLERDGAEGEGGGGRTGGGGDGADDDHESQRSRLLTPNTPTTTSKSPPPEREWRGSGEGGRGQFSSSTSSTTIPSAGEDPGREGQSSRQVLGGGDSNSKSRTFPGGRGRGGGGGGGGITPSPALTTVLPVSLGGDEDGHDSSSSSAAVLDYGGGGKDPNSDPLCLPRVEIRAVGGEGREGMLLHRICRERQAMPHTPIVFQSSSSVRIVYEWALGQSSGFTLFFHLSSTGGSGVAEAQPERCVHTCDGATRCLSERRMLCDGRYDCLDRSDEGTPVCRLATSPSASRPLDGESLVQIIVIPSCAVAVVVVLSAVCLIGRRRWLLLHQGGGASGRQGVGGGRGPLMQHHHQHHHHHHHQQHHRGHGGLGHASPCSSCLQSHGSESSVTRACSLQECSSEQAVALLPSSSHRSHISWPSSSSSSSHLPRSSHTLLSPAPHPPHPSGDPHIELPPNIPVSPDGEEGYAVSQLGLRHPRYHHHYSAHSSDLLFRPPPNKTVFDRESPPPYSVAPSLPPTPGGTYGCRSAPCPTSPVGLAVQSWPGHERTLCGDSVVGGPSTAVSRCRSMMAPPFDCHAPSSSSSSSVEGPLLHHPSSSSANPGCAGPDPPRLSLFHGACRKTDNTQSSPSSPLLHLSKVAPISCSSSSSPASYPPVVSSSPVPPACASSSATLLPTLSSSSSSSSSPGEVVAVCSAPTTSSRTTVPCRAVCCSGGGPGQDSRCDSGGGDSSGEDRSRDVSGPPPPPRPPSAQLGALPSSTCQGAVFGWTGHHHHGEDTTS
ncbi:uncharacterized protein LOC143285433 isoform X2 [Babylonia areolata]|uniref:uncharacterized protein LOC143285433 isoform X2 n=1 Tax=Babylonia areolata TaxID=304850 RepID=UPI003FD583BA